MFAWLWVPSMVLGHCKPEVFLAFQLPRRLTSPRIKEATRVGQDRWTHHARLEAAADVDAEVEAWLAAAMDEAVPR